MPFDPMYQLLPFPISHPEFSDGKTAAGKALFDYNDSISLYNTLSEVGKAAAELRRIEATGVANKLLQDRLINLKKVVSASASKDAFGESQKTYRYAFTLYRALMDLKRRKFANTADADLRSRVDSIEFYIKKSRSLLAEAIPVTDSQRDPKTSFTASIDKFWTEVAKQKDFAL
jgi:hypothetical protein